ncbi:MAG: hypothetical protein WKF55_10930 [Gemmatimonadaceae bacterium]
MNSRRVVVPVAILLYAAVLACDDDSRKAAADSAAMSARAPAVVAPVLPSTGWDEAAGPALILSTTNDPLSAAVILPGLTDNTLASSRQSDSSVLSNSRVELFGPGGLAGEAVFQAAGASTSADSCQSWPQGRISQRPKRPWRVGFEEGRMKGVPLDSIEGMSDADSAAFTAEILRIVMPYSQRGDSAFHGLPFSVRKAYRFPVVSTRGFIASVVRKINEEANPRQEHFLVIAERSGGSYREVFQSRASGAEDSVRTNEILAVMNLVETGQTAIAVTFEDGEGWRVGLLERVSGGQWRVMWKSAYTSC